MSSHKVAGLAIALTLIAACTSSSAPALDPKGPASPIASETPGPAGSGVLDPSTARVELAPSRSPLQPDGDNKGSGSTSMPGMHMHQDHAPGSATRSATSQTAAQYTCPMHPKVKQDQPGNCPICGMKLVIKEAHNAEQGEQK